MSKSLKGIEKGSYKDNPMVVCDPEGRYSFQFGGSKAAQLAAACALSGIAVVMRLIMDVAGDKLEAKHVEKINAELQCLKLGSTPKAPARTSSKTPSTKSPPAGSTPSKTPTTQRTGKDRGKTGQKAA